MTETNKIMQKPDKEDFIYPDENSDGTILGYLDSDEYIEELEKYVEYLESLITQNDRNNNSFKRDLR